MIYVYTYIHIFTYIYIYLHIFTYIYIYLHIFTYIYTYIYIYIHIFTYTYEYVYIYIYTHVHSLKKHILSCLRSSKGNKRDETAISRCEVRSPQWGQKILVWWLVHKVCAMSSERCQDETWIFCWKKWPHFFRAKQFVNLGIEGFFCFFVLRWI